MTALLIGILVPIGILACTVIGFGFRYLLARVDCMAKEIGNVKAAQSSMHGDIRVLVERFNAVDVLLPKNSAKNP